MLFRFAFAFTLGSLSCTASVQAQEMIPHFNLTAARDSFVVQVQGRPMGHLLLITEPYERGVRITEQTRIGTFVQQDTELDIDRVKKVARVTQRGVMRGQNASIDLEYTPGHVKGSATIPAPDGVRNHAIDMKIPDEALDDNLLQATLANLPWSETSHWKLPMFSAGKNDVTEIVMKVLATEKLTTSNGDVEVYRVELSGGDAPVMFWLQKAAPHRIMKMGPVGAPFEIVRAN